LANNGIFEIFYGFIELKEPRTYVLKFLEMLKPFFTSRALSSVSPSSLICGLTVIALHSGPADGHGELGSDCQVREAHREQ